MTWRHYVQRRGEDVVQRWRRGGRGTIQCTWIEYVPNERVTIQVKGGIDARQTWVLRPLEGKTKVDVAAEYTVPVSVHWQPTR